jgi:cytochrome c5
MTTSRTFLALLLATVLASSLALASEGGNPKKGKFLFKKNCKECHSSGAAGGEVTPLSKTQAQWDRFFETDKHSKSTDAVKNVSPEEMKDIQQFLYDHAADSDQPQTCG